MMQVVTYPVMAFCLMCILPSRCAALAPSREDIYGSSMESDGGGSLLGWAALIAFCYLFYLYSLSKGWNEKAAPTVGLFIWFVIEFALAILNAYDLYVGLCGFVIIAAGIAFAVRLYEKKQK